MKAKKTLILVAAVALIAAIAIGGTLAYLTAKTDSVVNTFTVGNITLSIAEKGADENLKKSYKVIPGATDDKEPVITVEKGSEPCYVYACVDNGLVLIDGTKVGTVDIKANDWTVVGTDGTKTTYVYKAAVDASEADVALTVFTKVTYDGAAITETNIGDLNEKTITITGYAHQSAIDDQATANAAANTYFGTVAPAETPAA